VPAQHELDLALHERYHEIGVLFSRQAEDVLDPLGFEAPDEQIRCFAFGWLIRQGSLPAQARHIGKARQRHILAMDGANLP